ncbi:MAG: methionyl-tRNA formyltransferase [Fimbriimonadaceae bacterium]|nr:methionyl-tRNA formyltransferase [Fimbriimonadaceae bacterium]
MTVVYFGTGDFAVPALRAVASAVALVVAQPDRPSGRGMTLRPTPVKAAALELGLEVATPESCREEAFVQRVRILRPDVLLVASYGQLMPVRLLEAARCGGINLHGSILPRYRGAAPIQRAIQAGETETGVSLMQMAKGMDTGDIIAIERTPIDPDETAGELFERLAVLAARMALGWLPRLSVGDYPRTPQDEADASLAPKIEPVEGRIRCERDAKPEYDRFRAFTPSPGAYIESVHGRIRLVRARRSEGSGEPGTVLSVAPVLTVACRTGALELHEVRPQGKTGMTGRDFVNGARLAVGSRLVRPETP